MTRLAALAAFLIVLAPGAAHAAACSPLNCAPSQFAVSGTTLLGYRSAALGAVHVVDLRTGAARFTVPGGFVGGHTLVHAGSGHTLSWYDLRTGAKTATITLPWSMRFAGVSQDGSRAVGFRAPHGAQTAVIATAAGWQRQVPLPKGNWDFDALSGENLFLIKYLRTGGYEVVLVDLANDSYPTRVIKDPHATAEIWGSPFARLASPDGRYLFTLYVAANGAAMVHELDVVHATARCIDLPGSGYFNFAVSWTMALSPNGRTLWAANPGYGRVVGIDVARHEAVVSHRISLPWWDVSSATRSTVSPGGHALAFTDGAYLAVYDLSRGKLVTQTKAKELAIGYAPDGLLRRLA
ncbi:MAG TPA: hypothetical protein VFB25_04445 [Gaiellaceae bacterium]|nr:hypothetical protein [Gaiellaceae bacterium]